MKRLTAECLQVHMIMCVCVNECTCTSTYAVYTHTCVHIYVSKELKLNYVHVSLIKEVPVFDPKFCCFSAAIAGDTLQEQGKRKTHVH